MGRKTKAKSNLDKEIQRHGNEIVEFTLVSDELGVLDFVAPVKEMFDTMQLVYLDDRIKAKMTAGKLYSYASVPFKGACHPNPSFMFKAGVDDASDDLFNTDPTVPYKYEQVYVFPASVLMGWLQPPKRTMEYMTQGAIRYDLPEGFDIEALESLMDEGVGFDALQDYLTEHGAIKVPTTKDGACE